tara:strand:+ start:388 stop:633 length:246 start_codon:yes stop_codon:yes gene_type:complete
MKTLSICLKNSSEVQIQITEAQFNELMAQFNAHKSPDGKLIVRSVDICDEERVKTDGYEDNENGCNWAYASTGRMEHPSDK